MLGKQAMFSFSRDALAHKYMKHLNMYVCISWSLLDFSNNSLRKIKYIFPCVNLLDFYV